MKKLAIPAVIVLGLAISISAQSEVAEKTTKTQPPGQLQVPPTFKLTLTYTDPDEKLELTALGTAQRPIYVTENGLHNKPPAELRFEATIMSAKAGVVLEYSIDKSDYSPERSPVGELHSASSAHISFDQETTLISVNGRTVSILISHMK